MAGVIRMRMIARLSFFGAQKLRTFRFIEEVFLHT
jgi:hypothetical protein